MTYTEWDYSHYVINLFENFDFSMLPLQFQLNRAFLNFVDFKINADMSSPIRTGHLYIEFFFSNFILRLKSFWERFQRCFISTWVTSDFNIKKIRLHMKQTNGNMWLLNEKKKKTQQRKRGKEKITEVLCVIRFFWLRTAFFHLLRVLLIISAFGFR